MQSRYYPPAMSLCHFRPTKIVNKDTLEEPDPQHNQLHDDHKMVIVCSYCNQPCDTVPNFSLDATNLELTLRRYKEGDMNFEDAYDSVNDLAKAGIVDLLIRIGELKYRREP